MLASGIKGKRIQLRFGSELPGSIFMRRRLGCPVCLQRGAPPPFHFILAQKSMPIYGRNMVVGYWKEHIGARNAIIADFLDFYKY
jgi:hypothetical protein